MAVSIDDSPQFKEFAHPERLVSTEWLADHLGDEGLVVVESDEDVLLYDTGHIPGSVKVDWHNDLNDPLTRDYVDGPRFAEVLGQRGIGRDTTVVIYGDKNNWWAAYALWVFSLFGHEDVRLLDGGRDKWIAEGRPITSDAAVAYCRIGERSSHTWFVLKHLLGFEDVRNYDGSWTEWGSAVRVPIVTGSEPGEVPAR